MAEAPANPSSSASESLGESLGGEALQKAVAELGATLALSPRDAILTVTLERDVLLSFAQKLKSDEVLSFEMLLDVAGVDWLERNPRFDVVYHLWSLRHNRMLRLKVGVPEEDLTCPSLVSIWGTADWHEREAFDLFGICFEGHPDLRRILMPDDYPWHPLRKDFPLEGIDNAFSYLRQGGVLMTPELEVNRPAGQDRTPVDLSHGDPPGFSDGATRLET